VIRLQAALQRAAGWLRPERDAVLSDWSRAVADARGIRESDARDGCSGALDALLERLAAGDVEGLLAAESSQAQAKARRAATLLDAALEMRVMNRCLAKVLLRACPDASSLGETLEALHELGERRLEALLRAQEQESARLLVEAQEHGARAAEHAREVERANSALRRAEADSRRRASQIALISTVANRIAAVREPDELMQQAADVIRGTMNYGYVAVVVLDHEGVLVGRWAGRPGVGHKSAWRAQGPPGGVIGRAIRTRAPQVVGDVSKDRDYHPDVDGTRSEMVIPLLEAGEATGALDYQSEQPAAFSLDDVAASETLAEFLVIALRNARLYQEARRR
jgi:putative methionine-R-sulfoxide reductase with GAF domain